MAAAQFIQVIVPLKLEWEPYYRVPDGLEVKVGDRVKVLFANSFYVATVSAIGVVPALPSDKIQPIEAREDTLPAVSEPEIRFWRSVASYYLCTVGEVYKAAYPQMQHHQSRLQLSQNQPPQDSIVLSPAQHKALQAIRQGFDTGKPVLLHGVSGSGKTEIALKLALEAFAAGGSVLYLVPDITLSNQLEERIRRVFPSALCYHSGLTPGKRKLVAQQLRQGGPNFVLGTRSALFLPHRRLGLVVIDQEHDTAYKQDAPAPRYHARESAIMLALVHGAKVLLNSATPSLESLYNAEIRRFICVQLNERFQSGKPARTEIIDTVAERRKKGMAGSFSLKLLAPMKAALEAGQKILLLGPQRSYADAPRLEDELLELFPSARIGSLEEGLSDPAFDILLGNAYTARASYLGRLGLVAVVGADLLLSRQDFRADERALQVLEQLQGHCPLMVIQTREPGHPVFAQLCGEAHAVDRMLEERRIAGLPPFTRLVKVQLRDKNQKRVQYMAGELARELQMAVGPVTGPFTPASHPAVQEFLREIRLTLPRSQELAARKHALRHSLQAFEQSRKYLGHIILDIDPV